MAYIYYQGRPYYLHTKIKYRNETCIVHCMNEFKFVENMNWVKKSLLFSKKCLYNHLLHITWVWCMRTADKVLWSCLQSMTILVIILCETKDRKICATLNFVVHCTYVSLKSLCVHVSHFAGWLKSMLFRKEDLF